jgi:hypothetical protein
MLWSFSFHYRFEVYSINSSKTISYFPEVSNFNRLFLTLNQFISKQPPVLPVHWAEHNSESLETIMAKGCDYEIMKALEIHLKARPHHIKLKSNFTWSRVFKCRLRTAGTGFLTAYYFIVILLMSGLLHKIVMINHGLRDIWSVMVSQFQSDPPLHET